MVACVQRWRNVHRLKPVAYLAVEGAVDAAGDAARAVVERLPLTLAMLPPPRPKEQGQGAEKAAEKGAVEKAAEEKAVPEEQVLAAIRRQQERQWQTLPAILWPELERPERQLPMKPQTKAKMVWPIAWRRARTHRGKINLPSN
ncbi:MAG: hypothetical protein PHZ19_02790 [Candidatus Thermoplasmatota archaeon]|nr:hypothetical protein [Candidatus Thermoplasmatota archaeon]